MAYKYVFNFDDGSTLESDDTFATEEDAEREAQNDASAYSQGGDYLELAGRGRCPQEIVDWDIIEV